MATPSTTGVQAQLRPELGASVQQFDAIAAEQGMVGLQVMRPKSVPIQNGYIGLIKLEELMKDDVQNGRAPGAMYARQDTKFTNFTFSTAEYGEEEVLDDRERALYSMYLDQEMIAAQRIQGRLMRRLEKEILDQLMDTTNNFTAALGLTTTASAAWTTASTDIIGDVKAAKLAMRAASGMLPNVMVVSLKTYLGMCVNTAIIDRMKYAGFRDPQMAAFMADTNVMAQAVGVDKILVSGMMRNSAKEGQSRSLASLWTETVVGFYRAAVSDDIKEPCVGRTFVWTEDGANPDGSVVFDSMAPT